VSGIRRLVLCAWLASALAVPCGVVRGDQAFRSGIEAVRVDVLVVDRGEPVRGLKAEDFEIRDNGVLQQIDRVSFEQIPLNVVLALDMSGSLEGDRLEHLRGAAGALLDGLKEDDQAALVTFSHMVVQQSGLTKDVAQVRAALGKMSANGYTSLVDGAYAGMILAQSDSDRALEVVFSDGVDTASWLTPAAVLDSAKRSDVVVYTVYAGPQRAPRFLRDLAGFTGGQVFENPDQAALRPTFTRILAEFRQRYLVTYSPRDVAPGGWHQLRVRLKSGRGTVKARPGYMRG
jgi:VWFA-related protein